MSSAIPSRVTEEQVRDLPQSAPLSEAAWQAWLLKGRLREERNYWRGVKAASSLSLVGIACAACVSLFPGFGAYDVPIRFAVAIGALALMVHNLHIRRYAFAAAFAALVVLFNPVAPLVDFPGIWGRGLIALSAVPFVASLTPSPKLARSA
jgi:hypothetical protein